MAVYLDIGAKRIQAYLARTPKLRGRRGASALLDNELLRSWTEHAWGGHARINGEGKQADGVLSLVFDDDDVTEPEVNDVVTETTALLQGLAPGAEWEVRVRRAATYRAALRAGEKAERSGHALLPGEDQQVVPVPPAPAELPIVRFCEYCGVDAAVTEQPVEPGDPTLQPLCADCSRRLVEGGFRTDQRNWSETTKAKYWQAKLAPGGLAAERALQEGVSQSLAAPAQVANEFEELARLGRGDANHLCTIFVDGNRFGALFASLKDTGVSLKKLSAALAAAVGEALRAATREVTFASDSCLPVVPHLIGGDDLLASVTADRAWDFVLAFLAEYHRQTGQLAVRYRHQAGKPIDTPTASAGLVFAHYKFPFASALDLAEAALKRAKLVHQARTAAVCWVDVTEDGPALPEDRAAPSLPALQQHRTALDGLVAIEQAGQAQLSLAAGDPQRVAALAHRLGRTETVLPFLQPAPPMPLRDALVLGRWWRCRQPA
jgi:hypothetical protein